MKHNRDICWNCLLGGGGIILLALATIGPVAQRVVSGSREARESRERRRAADGRRC